MKFVDDVAIFVRAGAGGGGAVSFRHERGKPLAGPDGGDGGNGGDVIVEANERKTTLLDLQLTPRHRAGDGGRGGRAERNGANGRSVVIRVPRGCEVWDEDTGRLVADLVAGGERVVVARGGCGGRGNAAFRDAVRRAPDTAEPGTEGEEFRLRISLKLLADVGIVGFPNAGKSTFLSVVSAARPRVADYPFTTLTPMLGTVGRDVRLVIADIPGLIAGAHAGRGLGIKFLKHVQRTRVLCHLLAWSDEPGRDPMRDFEAVNRELSLFDSALGARPQVVALNKCDLVPRERVSTVVADFAARGVRLFPISCAARDGVEDVVDALRGALTGR